MNNSEVNNSTSGTKASSNTAKDLSALQRAALTIKELRNQLDKLNKEQLEPIAIVGMSCVFPGASDLDEYWDLLSNGRDAVKKVPESRWDLDAWYDQNPASPGRINTQYGGFIEGVEYFDAKFFGIPNTEAKAMDPGQRILLQQVWRALEHASIPPDSLKGSNTGFFVGMSQNDYGSLQINGHPDDITAYSGTGNGHSFAAGRIAYQFGFHGPTFTSDTACSSSLVALYNAVNAIRKKESSVAIASGVHLNLTPPMQVFFSRTQSFSPDGRCFTFDERANGFILGEGVGVVVLQSLSEAIKQQRRILGVIREVGLNHGGAAVGLTVPNESAQEKLIAQTLKRAKISPESIQYIETHGTGTQLGDPIEVGALKAVFGSRKIEAPLLLGSVKTNIGHLNAAAGIAGFIKTILMLKNEKVAPNLHFNKPNPKIPWEGFNVEIPTALKSWDRSQDNPRRAGISSFGLSGTNGHALVEEAPITTTIPMPKEQLEGQSGPLVFAVSSKSKVGLVEVAKKYVKWLDRVDESSVKFSDFCYSTTVGRSHLTQCALCIASNFLEAREVLNAIISDEKHSNLTIGKVKRRGSRKGVEQIVNSSEKLSLLVAKLDDQRHIVRSPLFLTEVINKHFEGWNLDWKEIQGNYGQNFIDLPLYPFIREKFWLDDVQWQNEPVLKEIKAAPQNLESHQQQGQSQAAPQVLESHQLKNQKQQSVPLSTNTTSLKDIMELQLKMATEALGKVTEQQFQYLATIRDRDKSPQNSVTNPENIGVDPLKCGSYQLLIHEYEDNQGVEDAKKGLKKGLSEPGSMSLLVKTDQVNTTQLRHRAMLVCKDIPHAHEILDNPDSKDVRSALPLKESPSMIFMFPGVGDHYVDMGKGLYQSDDTFKRVVDECCEKVARDCGVHIKEILYPERSTTGEKTETGRSKLTSESSSETKGKTEAAPPKFDFRAMMKAGSTGSPAQQKMNETKISQPVVFIIEYALAMMWMSKGVHPEAMIGYSIGEYVAAVLSGVMSIDDALMLVTKRAQLIDKLPKGAMLAVPLSEEEVQKELIGSLAVAVRSTPNQTVIAGELGEIEELEKILRSKDIVSRKLQSTHAFHTAMLQSLHTPLLELVNSFELKAPKTPFISNLSGTWITEKEATDPSYWARHTWQKVDFSNGMGRLLELSSFNGNNGRIFLEVGPGISLGSFMLQHPNAKQISNKMNMASMRTMYERIQDEQYMLQTLGKIYLTGYTFSKNHIKGD